MSACGQAVTGSAAATTVPPSSKLPPLFVGQRPLDLPLPDAPQRDSQMSEVSSDDRAQTEAAHEVFEVYLGSLPPQVSATALLELCNFAGPATVNLPQAPDGGHRGFAFGQFATLSSANYAVSLLNGIMLGGQALRVRLANSTNAR